MPEDAEDVLADPKFDRWLADRLQETRQRCLLCGDSADDRHHIQYLPEQRVVHLCRECHGKVHERDGFHDELQPDRDLKSLSAEERNRLQREENAGQVEVVTDISDV